MSLIGKFAQPDSSPTYFIDFLDFLDRQEDIRNLRAKAASRMNLAAGQRALDLGCGIGGATFPLAEITGPAGLAAGVDISMAMVEAATKRVGRRPGVEFKVGEACAIPYPGDFFDSARCERVFLYLPDRLGAIQEMKRVVKPGGRIVLMDTELDTTAVYSKKLALTRKMTSIVASDHAEPKLGAGFAGTGAASGLERLKTEILAISAPHEFFLKVMAGSLADAVEKGVVPAAEVEEWLEEQASLEAQGDFFQAWLFVLVSGTV